MSYWLLQIEGSKDSPQWIAISIGLLALAYLLMRPKFGRNKDPLDSGPRFSISQQRSLERGMNNLVVELSEMSRQITAQLDTRSARLELLIKEADRKIAQLRQLEAAAGMDPPEMPPTPRDMTAPTRDEPADLRHTDVYALADAGHTAADIAQQLNRPSGEIELILALRSSTTSQ